MNIVCTLRQDVPALQSHLCRCELLRIEAVIEQRRFPVAAGALRTQCRKTTMPISVDAVFHHHRRPSSLLTSRYRFHHPVQTMIQHVPGSCASVVLEGLGSRGASAMSALTIKLALAAITLVGGDTFDSDHSWCCHITGRVAAGSCFYFDRRCRNSRGISLAVGHAPWAWRIVTVPSYSLSASADLANGARAFRTRMATRVPRLPRIPSHVGLAVMITNKTN
jgi:hypothetical protein